MYKSTKLTEEVCALLHMFGISVNGMTSTGYGFMHAGTMLGYPVSIDFFAGENLWVFPRELHEYSEQNAIYLFSHTHGKGVDTGLTGWKLITVLNFKKRK